MREQIKPFFYRWLKLSNHFDANMQEVLSGASIAFLLRLAGAALTFGFSALLARMLGAEGAGLYFLALTATTVATVFSRMGLDNTLLRYTAAGAAANDWRMVSGIYKKSMTIAMTSSVVLSVFVFIASPWLAENIFYQPALSVPMRWMSLAIIPLTFLILLSEMLRGLKRILDYQIVQGISLPAILLPTAYLMGKQWGINGVVWAYILAASLSAVLGYKLWRAATPHLSNVVGKFETSKIFLSSVPLFTVALMDIVMNWASIVLLGVWYTGKEVGIFAITLRTAMLISFVLFAINSIIAPKFAIFYKQGDIRSLESMVRHSTMMMVLSASPALLLFILAPEWVMAFFGNGFKEGAVPLVILSIGQFVNVATGSVGYLLTMCGYEKLMRNNIVACAALNVIMNVLLIPKYSIIGAAIANAVAMALMNISLAIIVYFKLSIKTFPAFNFAPHKGE